MYKGFVAREINGLRLYQIPSFSATGLVTHGFTTRMGGFSESPYASLNTALHVGDEVQAVLANRARVCEALDINPGDLVTGRQVHGDAAHFVTAADKGRGAFEYADALPETDALATNITGTPMASFYADCVPVFLLDPVSGVVALVHAGWKGTSAKICLKTVLGMKERYGVEPSDCLAGIGPSIGPCCYEVGDSVACAFREGGFPSSVLNKTPQRGKWMLNLWQANLATLLEAGLKPENVTLADLCSACGKDIFFSYRAEEGVTGRMCSLIMLK